MFNTNMESQFYVWLVGQAKSILCWQNLCKHLSFHVWWLCGQRNRGVCCKCTIIILVFYTNNRHIRVLWYYWYLRIHQYRWLMQGHWVFFNSHSLCLGHWPFSHFVPLVIDCHSSSYPVVNIIKNTCWFTFDSDSPHKRKGSNHLIDIIVKKVTWWVISFFSYNILLCGLIFPYLSYLPLWLKKKKKKNEIKSCVARMDRLKHFLSTIHCFSMISPVKEIVFVPPETFI